MMIVTLHNILGPVAKERDQQCQRAQISMTNRIKPACPIIRLIPSSSPKESQFTIQVPRPESGGQAGDLRIHAEPRNLCPNSWHNNNYRARCVFLCHLFVAVRQCLTRQN